MRLTESYPEFMLRWYLYRRRKNNPGKNSMLRFRRALHATAPGALAIDCGANVGDITNLLVLEGFRVIAFEPDPVALKVLLERFGTHPQVTIIPKAVGGTARTAALYQRPEVIAGNVARTDSSSIMRFDHHLESPFGEIEVVGIVDFLRSLNEPVELLKLDIEGAEIEVLNAVIDAQFDRAIKWIFAETHESLHADLATGTVALRQRLAREAIHNIDLDWH